jgi:hypothetical protein
VPAVIPEAISPETRAQLRDPLNCLVAAVQKAEIEAIESMLNALVQLGLGMQGEANRHSRLLEQAKELMRASFKTNHFADITREQAVLLRDALARYVKAQKMLKGVHGSGKLEEAFTPDTDANREKERAASLLVRLLESTRENIISEER